MVGSDMRNLVSVGKIQLSLHMAYREDDKNSYSNRTIIKKMKAISVDPSMNEYIEADE